MGVTDVSLQEGGLGFSARTHPEQWEVGGREGEDVAAAAGAAPTRSARARSHIWPMM